MLGARRVIVLWTGLSCVAEPRSSGALSVALHALNLLISRLLVTDLERVLSEGEIRAVPPPCPIWRSEYDFAHSTDQIESAKASTRRRLAAGGLEAQGVPAELEPHLHE